MQGLLPHGVKESSRNETCSYIINTTIGEQDHAGIVWKTSPAATRTTERGDTSAAVHELGATDSSSRVSAGYRPRR